MVSVSGVLMAMADVIDMEALDVDTIVQVCVDNVHDAVPTCMASWMGSTTLIKLPICNLFLTVNSIVYVVIALTSVTLGVTVTADITPAVHDTAFVVRVSIA